MARIALGLQYDGTAFNGYQKQPERNTVQDHLEMALEQFTTTRIATTCAGRTDAGVHALEQVVHFDTDLERSLQSWVRGVNSFLPPAVSVRWAHVAPQCPEVSDRRRGVNSGSGGGGGGLSKQGGRGQHADRGRCAGTD